MSSVCLSVRLSICDVGELWSHRLELFKNNFTTSLPGTFALCNPNMTGLLLQGEHPKFGPKVTHPCWFERWRHSIANCVRMVTHSATVTMESLYRKPPSLFRMVPSLTPYDLPFPRKWGFHVTQDGHISATGDPIHFMFGSMVGFSGTADRTALFPGWRPPPSWKNFKWPYLRNGSRSTYIARIAWSSLRCLNDCQQHCYKYRLQVFEYFTEYHTGRPTPPLLIPSPMLRFAGSRLWCWPCVLVLGRYI